MSAAIMGHGSLYHEQTTKKYPHVKQHSIVVKLKSMWHRCFKIIPQILSIVNNILRLAHHGRR
jgi:hypothetical protein